VTTDVYEALAGGASACKKYPQRSGTKGRAYRLTATRQSAGEHLKRCDATMIGTDWSQSFDFGILIRPSQRLLLFSSQEYSIISQSGRSVNVRVLFQGLANVLGSSMIIS
jgi:hypothetical protein